VMYQSGPYRKAIYPLSCCDYLLEETTFNPLDHRSSGAVDNFEAIPS
jgi:hypothetical protein